MEDIEIPWLLAKLQFTDCNLSYSTNVTPFYISYFCSMNTFPSAQGLNDLLIPLLHDHHSCVSLQMNRGRTGMARFILLLLLLALGCLAAGQDVASEPETSAEPEPEPEGYPEPEPEGEPESTAISYSEPEPNWPEAKQLWGSAWEV